MLKGPKIKLAVDLNRISEYFPLGEAVQEGFGFDLVVERPEYEAMAGILADHGVAEERIILEFCFLRLWVMDETGMGEGTRFGRFQRMRAELAELNQYLISHRITKVTFSGTSGRDKGEEEYQLKEDVNIDRLCDGLRCIFKEDFEMDPSRRKSKGMAAWRRRKMEKVRNSFLNYFTAVPELDKLSLEEQNELIDRITQSFDNEGRPVRQ
jgi:hypothetical protein